MKAKDTKPQSSPMNNESLIPRKPRLTAVELLNFTYEGLSPVEPDLSGVYGQFHWQDNNSLQQWNGILREDGSWSEKLFLPPLLLNEGNVVIVIYGQRQRNEFRMWGGFHPKVPASVTPLNVQLKLSLTFPKKDGTQWTVDKETIVTVEHEIHLFENRFFTLYEVPFASLSSSSAPAATNISIARISPDENESLAEEKWFYWGLAPRFSKDGIFDMIDCTSLNGTYECVREWKEIVEVEQWSLESAYLCLPPLILLTSDTGQHVTVCVFGWRITTRFLFLAKFHPSTPENQKTCKMLIKMDLHVTTYENENLTLSAENTVTLDSKFDVANPITFMHFPWSSLSPSICPRVSLSIQSMKQSKKRCAD